MSKVKVYKPTTSARRGTSVIDYSKVLTKQKPHKALLKRKKTSAGRSNGKIDLLTEPVKPHIIYLCLEKFQFTKLVISV